ELERDAKQQQYVAKKQELTRLQDQIVVIKSATNQEMELEASATRIEWENIKNEQYQYDSEKKYLLNQQEEIEKESRLDRQEEQSLRDEEQTLEQIGSEIDQKLQAAKAELQNQTAQSTSLQTEKMENLSEQKNLHNQLL